MQGKLSLVQKNIFSICLILCVMGCAQKKIMAGRTKLNMQQKGSVIVSNSESLLGDLTVKSEGNKVIYPYVVYVQNDSAQTTYEIDLKQVSFKLAQGNPVVRCKRDSLNPNADTKLPPKSGFAISCDIAIEKKTESTASLSDLTGVLKLPFISKELASKNAEFEFEVIILGKDLS